MKNIVYAIVIWYNADGEVIYAKNNIAINVYDADDTTLAVVC